MAVLKKINILSKNSLKCETHALPIEQYIMGMVKHSKISLKYINL